MPYTHNVRAVQAKWRQQKGQSVRDRHRCEKHGGEHGELIEDESWRFVMCETLTATNLRFGDGL